VLSLTILQEARLQILSEAISFEVCSWEERSIKRIIYRVRWQQGEDENETMNATMDDPTYRSNCEWARHRLIAASHEGPNTPSDQESMTMPSSVSWHRIGDARSANSSWMSPPDACHSYLSFNSIYYCTIRPLAVAYSSSFRVFVHVACALKLEAERRPCLCIYTDIASRDMLSTPTSSQEVK
jgi:hypothetical protein